MSKPKHVEWKDTKLDFCIDRNYSLFSKNRYVFFYGLSKQWKKNINYAANFTKVYNICVVYLYGTMKIESMQKHLNTLGGNIVVIYFPVADDDLKSVKSWNATFKKLKSQGMTDGEQISQAWYDEYAKIKSAVDNGFEDANDIYQEYRKTETAIESYNVAMEHITAQQKQQSVIYSNFGYTDTIYCDEKHDEELLKIARRLYPYGVESDTTDEFAVKVLGIKKLLVESTAKNPFIQPTAKKLNIVLDDDEQMSLFSQVTIGANEFIRTIRNKCDDDIAKCGCVSVSDLIRMAASSPFGMYECNWYNFLFAVALHTYYKPQYRFYRARQAMPIERFEYAEYSRVPQGYIFVPSKEYAECLEAMNYIFDCNFTSMTSAIPHAAVGYISNHIQTPLDCADHRWHELLAQSDFDMWCKRETAEYFHDWLVTNKEAHKKLMHTIDSDMKAELSKKYGNRKVEQMYKYYHVDGGASGWLHSKESFYERVEKYMANDVCRECGRPIDELHNASGAAYIVNTVEDARTLKFTLKDIIGINKKMIGRYTTDYFCIPCLCEYLETTPEAIYEKIHEFKEQGCELF